ncbi:MAG: hypothetical protein KatS3mg109_1326 [Pirellulaceae bacterium]|nr:MAG: hypothetical protein KatS3mg109_1326 [Pirellulaceae bacterium]
MRAEIFAGPVRDRMNRKLEFRWWVRCPACRYLASREQVTGLVEPVGLPDIDPDVWLRQEME